MSAGNGPQIVALYPRPEGRRFTAISGKRVGRPGCGSAVAFAWLKDKLKPFCSPFPPGERRLDSAPGAPDRHTPTVVEERRVIVEMREHHLAAIRDDRYEICKGVHPNHPAARSVAHRFARFTALELKFPWGKPTEFEALSEALL